MAAVAVKRKGREEKMRNKLLYSKLIWFLFGFLFLISVFIPITQAQNQTQDINLNGVWKSSFGSTVEVRQAGGVIKGTIKQSETSSRIGTTDMTGSFDGGSIEGEVYLWADNRSCSFLDGPVSATGTVSPDSNTITFKWDNRIYNDETCKFTGEKRQGTTIYTKIISQNSPAPASTTIAAITLQPTVLLRTGGNSDIKIGIPGYVQALVDKPPKASDFQNIPQSDFRIVYPTSTVSATPKPATDSAGIKDSIFIGKVGDKGEVVVESPNGERIFLTDDRSGYNFFNSRFGITFPGSPLGNPAQVKIVEQDCHLLLAKNNRSEPTIEGEPYRERYADIWDVQTTRYVTVGDCTYLNEGGSGRVLVEQGQVTFKTPGDVTVVADKADFGIGYDTKSNTSIVEVYNGSVKVTNKSGQSKTISGVYGGQINRIEVGKDGVMTEKIAIPQSEWEAFLASSQKKEKEVNIKSNSPIIPIVVVLGLGGLIFFLHRTGKLILLSKILNQKLSGTIKKTSKTGKEEKN